MALPVQVQRGVVALFMVLLLVLQGTNAVLAGTTGSISGVVLDASTNQPIAGAKITASSPSQSISTTSDAKGNFVFLSLAPDTYTVSVAPTSTLDTAVINGVTVQADVNLTLTFQQQKKLQQIGSTTARSQAALVRPGTTADVYSINATQQDKASSMGGGGTLNSAWSAITTVPGVYVMPGQAGYIGAGASLSIRGGDYDQIGYEFDGVPVNRSFDNYPSGTLSSLGQQEVQVYTGAAPANAEASGLSGYINQVIRTGTYPPTRSLTLALGSPTTYSKLAFEAGGANAQRTFSYYLGLGAYNQDFRYFDQYNGAGLSTNYGTPLTACSDTTAPLTGGGPLVGTCSPPGAIANGGQYATGGVYSNPEVNPNPAAPPGSFTPTTASYALGPAQIAAQREIEVRDSILNLHFGIPKADGTKDDVQALLDIDHLTTHAYTSADDIGTPAFVNSALGGLGTPFYIDGYQYGGKIGSVINPATAGSLVTAYPFPQSPAGLAFDGPIPNGTEGGQANDQNVFKLQYQHNFGTDAFLRVYGYTYYSDWMMTDPTAAYSEYYLGTFGAFSPDYELSSHTRGGSIEFSDQLNAQNLLTIQGNYTTSTTTRDNNTEWLNGLYGPNSVNARTALGVVVNAADPTAGYCFTPAGVATNCNYGGGAQYLTLQQAMGGANLTLPGSCALPGVASTTCEYLAVGNGEYATYNTVQPHFLSASITDNFKPTDKLNFDFGLRFDSYQFQTSSQNDNAARQLYYNSFNMYECFVPNSTTIITRTTAGSACPTGSYLPNIIDANGGTTTYSEIQPRFGMTYTLDPTTVLRASYGRYSQPPNTAFEQYDALQSNQPYLLYNTYGFQEYGFTSSLHHVGPEVSNNFDLSLEKSFGRDFSIKVSPFYRSTQDQIQQFFLSFISGFVSGLNVGQQTSEGVEFEADKGDFSRNGFAAKLSFTYTNSYIRYTSLPGGGTVIDPINNAILGYNAYTSYCATNPTAKNCAGGVTSSGVDAPCYTANPAGGGTAAAVAPVGGVCPTGSVTNPYWNLSAQPLINPNADFATYDILPSVPGTNSNAYGAPFVTTLLVQYKHNRLALTPALQFVGGQKYGTPESTYGVAPDVCGAIAGTSRYDVGTCGSYSGGGYYGNVGGYNMVVPDQQTGSFDNLGAFTEPNQVSLHLQASYEVSPRVTFVGTFANLWHSCFGGSKVPWAVSGACGYSPNNLYPIGNNYNPGAVIQPYVQNTYNPFFYSLPFNMYIEARIKI